MRRLRCDVLVASDWHLGSFSTPQESRLALAFLERAGASETDIILNGDIFEGLFESRATAESAHPAVVEAIQRLGAAGRLRRTEGNHDPGAGEAHLVVEHSVLGRVLVAHGHTADPSYGSWPLRLGNGISRRFGRHALVRGWARLAESLVAIAPDRVDAIFRARCVALIQEMGCSVGIFGHVHRQRVQVGEAYANAGVLRRNRLEYLRLGPSGLEAHRLTLAELEPSRQRVSPER